MTSWRRFVKPIGLGLVLIATAQITASAATAPTPTRAALRPAPAQPRPNPPAPQYIRGRINQLGSSFNGRVGIAVRSIDDGWSTGWKADELYPQQSVSKLWVAITAMDAVDKGKVSLDEPVTLTKDDLTLFHQPIADEVLKTGSFTTTLGDLMVREM